MAATPLCAATNDPAPGAAADSETDHALERLLAGMDEEEKAPLADQDESNPLFPFETAPADPDLDALLSVLTEQGSESTGPLDESNPLFPDDQNELADPDYQILFPPDVQPARAQPEQDASGLERKIGQLEETKEQPRAESKALAQELADAQSQCKQLDEKLKTTETDRAAETAQLRERLAALEAEQKQLAPATALTAIEQENQRLRKQQEESAAFLRDLRTETAAKDAQLKENKLNHAAEVGQLQKRLAALADELAQATASRNEQETLAGEYAKLKKELAETTQLLRSQLAREQAAAEALRAEANAKDDRIRSLQTEIKNAKDRAEQAEYLQKQLEDRAQNNLEAALRDKAELERRLARLGDAASGRESAASPAQDNLEKKPAGGLPPTQPIGVATAPRAQIRQLLLDGDNEAALAAARAARPANPDDVNLALLENLALIRLQRYAEAAGPLADLAKNHPRNAEVHAALGAAMMGSGFYDEAREILLLANRLDKGMPECLFNLAQLHAFIDPVDIPLARKFYVQARALGLASNPRLEKALQ